MKNLFSFRTLLSLTLPILFTARSFAENRIYITGTAVMLAYCDLNKPGASYSVKNKQKDKVTKPGTLDQYGCVNTELTGVQECEEVTLFINGQANNLTVPGQICGGGSSPSEPAQPSPPTPPRPADLADLNKVSEQAGNSARYFANLVKKNFEDGRYNSLYNFIVGFHSEQGINSSVDSSMYSNLRNQGMQEGSAQGTLNGRSSGEREGQAVASAKAKTDVRNQYLQGVDKDSAIIASVDSKIPTYIGANASLGLETSPRAILSRIEGESEISKGLSAIGLSASSSNLSTVISGQLSIRELLSEYNDYWAWNSFPGNATTEQQNYLNKLKQKDNATEALSQYERSFREEYWRVIDDKIASQIKAQNFSAIQAGVKAGQKIVGLASYNLGRETSYSTSFRSSSIEGFQSAYPSTYQNAFNASVQSFESSMIIDSVSAQVADQQGGSTFVIGQPVDLNISSILNVGRIGGKLNLKITGAIQKSVEIEIRGSSSNKGIVVREVGKISPTAKLGEQKINISVGGKSTEQIIKIEWKNQIKGLTTVTTPEGQHLLAQFIATNLLEEWKAIAADQAVVQEASPYHPNNKIGYAKTKLSDLDKMSEAIKAQGQDIAPIRMVVDEMLILFRSMLTPAAIKNLAGWYSAAQQEEFFKKQAEALQTVSSDPVRKALLGQCKFGNSGAPTVPCIQSVDNRTNIGNKWSNVVNKLEGIKRKLN